jgi:galactose mutarotase-like enzyme
MPFAQYRHYGCRITDQLTYKGMRAIFLENDLLRVGILLDKGADLFQLLHKPSDTDFLWRSPVGLLNPAHFNATIASSSGSFLDTYHGGWQEILPGGGPAHYRGAELGLHGEVAQLGWDCDILEDTPQRCSLRLQVDCVRTPFHLERVMSLEIGKPSLFFHETLTNRSPEAQELMWGHHPAFGAPFVRPGVRVLVPAQQAEAHSPQFLPSSLLEPGTRFDWPVARLGEGAIDFSQLRLDQAGFGELLYLQELQAGWYAVLDPEKQLGIGLAWPLEVFPYLWYWLVFGKAPGYPWWDQVVVIALEPWSSIPNHLDKAIERGTQLKLKGGAQIEFPMCATVITGREHVQAIDLDGKVR